MPCVKCSNGKWRFGSSKCMYTSLENCKAAERAYYADRNEKSVQEEYKSNGMQETKKKETR